MTNCIQKLGNIIFKFYNIYYYKFIIYKMNKICFYFKYFNIIIFVLPIVDMCHHLN